MVRLAKRLSIGTASIARTSACERTSARAIGAPGSPPGSHGITHAEDWALVEFWIDILVRLFLLACLKVWRPVAGTMSRVHDGMSSRSRPLVSGTKKK